MPSNAKRDLSAKTALQRGVSANATLLSRSEHEISHTKFAVTAKGTQEDEMAISTMDVPHGHAKAGGRQSLEYYLIFAVSFVVLLAAAVFERLMPWNWMSKTKRETQKSIIAGAWSAARTCTAYAFMG